jgi:hypothetical protein
MPALLQLATHADPRGSLTVLEREIPFPIRRVFVIHGVPEGIRRGGHRHKRTRLALVCFAGSCVIDCEAPSGSTSHVLDTPSQCLLIEPEDFHWMHSFSPHAVLVVLASEPFDRADYIHEGYGSTAVPH